MNHKLLTVVFIALGLAISLVGYQWVYSRMQPMRVMISSADSDQQTELELIPSGQEMVSGIKALWEPLSLFALMIGGILANQVYEQAKDAQSSRKKKMALGPMVGNIISNPRFWMAISVSPFVFYTTYGYVSQMPDGAVAMFYAFQNGFFWQAVFGAFDK